MINLIIFEAIILLLAIAFIIFLLMKTKIEGTLKKFLILTGASAVGFFIFALLHNLVSALLSQILNKEIEEPVFFILAVFISPIGFVVGVIGSIIQFIKQKKQS